MSNINESLRDWITYNVQIGDPLEGVDVITMGEIADREPQFIAIYETAADLYEQGAVTMYGVTNFELTVELHTVPASADDDGTATDIEQGQRTRLYDILGNRDAIDYMNGKEGWQVFDIRTGSPLTSAEDGRRISRSTLMVVASVL